MGQHDHLAAVRRIRADLLVARHPGVEDDLAVDVDRGPEGAADEGAAVFQDEGGDRFAGARFVGGGVAHQPTSWTGAPPTSVIRTSPCRRSPWSGVFLPLEWNFR